MIDINGVSYKYRGGKFVFKDISLSIRKGEVLSILGTNGTGKTTLIKVIAGVKKPDTGSVCFENKKIKISYVPQAKKINFPYNVLEFVCFGCYQKNSFLSKPKKEDLLYSEKILTDLGVSKLISKSINEISGGELQMCYFAKALVSDPDVIILDEPESNLDFINQDKIINYLHYLSRKKKTTIIFNTHFLNNANKISDKCLLVGADKYVFGNKEEVLQEKILEEYFLVPIKKCQVNNRDYYVII